MAESNADRIKGMREDYRKVFETPEGKKVLADLEKVGFWKTTTFVSNDAMTTIFNEGTRAFLLHIKTILELDVETLEKIRDASS